MFGIFSLHLNMGVEILLILEPPNGRAPQILSCPSQGHAGAVTVLPDAEEVPPDRGSSQNSLLCRETRALAVIVERQILALPTRHFLSRVGDQALKKNVESSC